MAVKRVRYPTPAGPGAVHFHTLISVGASVALTGILYPERRQQRWAGNKALAGCCAGLRRKNLADRG